MGAGASTIGSQLSAADVDKLRDALMKYQSTTLTVKIIRAFALGNADDLSYSDPFVVCYLEGQKNQSKKTTTVNNSLTPSWKGINGTITLSDATGIDNLVFEVFDDDSFREGTESS
eukprot:gene5043-10103_t